MIILSVKLRISASLSKACGSISISVESSLEQEINKKEIIKSKSNFFIALQM